MDCNTFSSRELATHNFEFRGGIKISDIMIRMARKASCLCMLLYCFSEYLPSAAQ
jgi:hypothetical protein